MEVGSVAFTSPLRIALVGCKACRARLSSRPTGCPVVFQSRKFVWAPGEATARIVGLPPGGRGGVRQGPDRPRKRRDCIKNTVKTPCFIGVFAGVCARLAHNLVKHPRRRRRFGVKDRLGTFGLFAAQTFDAGLEFGRGHLVRLFAFGTVLHLA